MLSVVFYGACLSYQMVIKPDTTSYALLHHDCFNAPTDTDLTTFIPTRRHACLDSRSAMFNPRPSRGFCAAQLRFSL